MTEPHPLVFAPRVFAVMALATGLLFASGCPDSTPGDTGEDVSLDALTDTADVGTVDGASDVLMDAQADTNADTSADAGPDAGPAPEVVALVDECRAQLALAEPYNALAAAEAALALAPDDPNALFCAALAGMLDRSEMALSLLKVADMAGTYTGAFEPSRSDEIAQELHEILAFLHEGFATGAARLDAIGDRDIDFTVDSAWLYNGPRPALVYRGRFDHGDVLLMRFVARFVVGFLDILRGQDMRGDTASLIAWAVGGSFKSTLNLSKILDLVAYLLADDEKFLALHPDEGPDAFAEARDVLLTLGPDLRAALAAVADAPAQAGGAADEPQATTAERTADGGGYVLHVHSRAALDDAGVLAGEEPIDFEIPREMLEGFDAVSTSVANPGTLVTFEEGPRYVLGLMLYAVVETRILGDIKLGSFSLTPGLLSASDIADLLGTLIKPVLAFDLGTFYQTPVGLRIILPRPESGGSGFGDGKFLTEWECPDDLDGDGLPTGWQSFVCPKDAALVDAPHFQGTPDEIAADGYTPSMPYMVWDDPSMGGLLYVNLHSVLDGAPDSFEMATPATISVAVSEALGPILDLLGN